MTAPRPDRHDQDELAIDRLVRLIGYHLERIAKGRQSIASEDQSDARGYLARALQALGGEPTVSDMHRYKQAREAEDDGE